MTTAARHETEIEIDQKVPLVRITREFDAPPEQVYRAHVDPARPRPHAQAGLTSGSP
jgi:hypothetical protein